MDLLRLLPPELKERSQNLSNRESKHSRAEKRVLEKGFSWVADSEDLSFSSFSDLMIDFFLICSFILIIIRINICT
jgi:hypothetical protein